MSLPREFSPLALVSIIEDDITRNGFSREKMIAAARDAVSGGMLNRVFGELPRIMRQTSLCVFGDGFYCMVRHAKRSEEVPFMPDDQTKQALERWTKYIIESAVLELLDVKGNINPCLIRLFGWDDLCDRLDKVQLVSAYVGEAILRIMLVRDPGNVSEFGIRIYRDNRDRVSNFISSHYPRWIKEVLAQKGFIASTSLTSARAAARADASLAPARAAADADTLFTPARMAAGAGALFGLMSIVAAIGLFAAPTFASTTSEYDGPKYH